MSVDTPKTNNASESLWSIEPRVHPLTVETLLNCVADLGTAAQGLNIKYSLFDYDGGWRVFQSIIRQMSVSLRKLCLDGDGGLLKKVIANPCFHPLGGNKGKYGRAKMSWHTERREWVFGYKNGKRETVVVPATEHRIEVGRLYGVDFVEGEQCVIHCPFDLAAPRIPMEAWLGSKALQVNSVSYTIRDVLRLVANYEGAHTNEMPAFAAVGVNPEDFDRGRNMKYRLINCVYFGCLSYANILTLYSALYIIREMQQFFTDVANLERLSELHASAVAQTIEHIHTDLTWRTHIVNATHEMIVVGKSNAPDVRQRQPIYHLWSGSHDWDAPY